MVYWTRRFAVPWRERAIIDHEDRIFLAQWAFRIVGAGVLVVSAAGIIGLAMRVFIMAAGG